MKPKKTKEMVQWAPGSKPQRMSRVLDEETYRQRFDSALRKSKGGIQKDHKVYTIKEGDMVLDPLGHVYTAGKVDYAAQSVMLGIHKHGFSCVRRLPDWGESMIKYVLKQAEAVDFDFRVEVVEIKKEPHPNADNLSVVTVFGKPVIIRSEDFKDGDKAAYIPPDARVLSLDSYYDWLGSERRRVRVRKYRGVKSHGLLVPVDHTFPIGADVQAFKEICHYKSTEPRNV